MHKRQTTIRSLIKYSNRTFIANKIVIGYAVNHAVKPSCIVCIMHGIPRLFEIGMILKISNMLSEVLSVKNDAIA